MKHAARARKPIGCCTVAKEYPGACKEDSGECPFLLRIDAKQYLQWIPHGTFKKRTVQSQMLLGYLQFEDFRECLEPCSGQGVKIVGKGLVHVAHGNGLAVPSPDVPFIGFIDTGEVV